MIIPKIILNLNSEYEYMFCFFEKLNRPGLNRTAKGLTSVSSHGVSPQPVENSATGFFILSLIPMCLFVFEYLP